MHARQQAEIAAWIAVHSSNILARAKNQDGILAEYYWVNSKSRTVRWGAALKIFGDDFAAAERDHNPWPAFEAIAEEIFISEMLTRIWSACLVSFDIERQKEEFTGLAYSIFVSHIEAKNRVFRLLLSAQGQNEQVFDRLNQLRRQVEKWTDLFLAWLPNQDVAAKFSFDKKRVEDFAQERGYYGETQSAKQQQVLINSMARAFSNSLNKWSANPELNRRIAAGVITCLEQDAFGSFDIPAAISQLWMEKSHTEAQVLVDRLHNLEEAPQFEKPHYLSSQELI